MTSETTRTGEPQRGRPRAADAPLGMAEARRRLYANPALTLTELAVLLGVSPSTVQRLAVKNKLPVPAFRLGQRWIIPSEPVKELLGLPATYAEAEAHADGAA